MTSFKVLFRHILGGTEVNIKIRAREVGVHHVFLTSPLDEGHLHALAVLPLGKSLSVTAG
jgi:hypothetical protein